MKPLNGELQSDNWDESCKYAKKEQNTIEILCQNNNQIEKTQSGDLTCKSTIKNFITLKNNSYGVVEPLIIRDGEKGWELTMFDEKTLGIANNVENSTYIIKDNLSWHCVGISENGNVSDFNDNVRWSYIYDNYLFKSELDINELILKKGTFRKYLIFYAEGI